ncbi:hypothetical protein CTAYLR_008367 [Chrysophaeum taylorii]|uniref:peptidylprolyl isomerase n=1 Tax=Chrysophaeum taylorii TaxID=2483200 RepID=A0AAD7UNR5_9STRA|nr:hypothetical protein CTAYLR_008367 [Chrysophaeum taylorii]
MDPIEVIAWPRSKEVRRASRVDPQEVLQRMKEGEGEPLIVMDAQEGWSVGTLASLAAAYGDAQVTVNDRAPLQEWDDPPMRTRVVRLREYAAYANGEGDVLSGSAWYLNSWEPFATYPELRETWSYPYFVEDLLQGDDNPKLLNYTKLLFGVSGCTTRLHVDDQQTHAWLAQIEGRKQVILFAPSDGDRLRLHAWEHDASRRALDPADPPDPIAYPRVYDATIFHAILAPGDTLLVPCGWWHYARCLDVSTTLMRNFANSANTDRFKLAVRSANDHAKFNSPKYLVEPGTACVVCRATTDIKPCSRCRVVSYCGRDCQRNHWLTSHKAFCPVLADLLSFKNRSSRTAATTTPTDLFAAPARDPPKTFIKHVIRDGKGGLKPNEDSMVRVHYEGFLADGQKIDSSRGPFDFHVSRTPVAKGWREATLTMRVGEKARIAVPAHAAYADRGVKGKVPPNSPLVFDVELLRIW